MMGQDLQVIILDHHKGDLVLIIDNIIRIPMYGILHLQSIKNQLKEFQKIFLMLLKTTTSRTDKAQSAIIKGKKLIQMAKNLFLISVTQREMVLIQI